MSKEISKYQNLDQIGGQFMNARNKLKKTESEISQILENKLKPEKEDLEKAIKKYNEKAKKVLESKDVKNFIDHECNSVIFKKNYIGSWLKDIKSQLHEVKVSLIEKKKKDVDSKLRFKLFIIFVSGLRAMSIV